MEVLSCKKINDSNFTTVSRKCELADSKMEKSHRGCFPGQRHISTLVGFLSCFLMASVRLTLGVGIVAMVKHKQTKNTFNWNGSEISCPFPPTPPKPFIESKFEEKFEWSTEIQGWLLGIGFLSLLITETPAGRLADVVGSKPMLVISNIVTGIITIISPFAASWHVYALLALQFLRGVSQGITLPAIFKLMSNWIPKNERGTLSTLVMCGFPGGLSLGGMLTGWLCDIPGFGWPSAFYIVGTLNVVLGVATQFLYYEHPVNHPWISEEELKYINDGMENKETEQRPPTPWKKIFTSVPTYAYFYGLFGHYWSITYFSTVHPTFMGTILHYPMTENGVTSCLPVLLKCFGGVAASISCYWITKKNLMGTDKLRKIATIVGSLGFSLCMAVILLVGCDATINVLCFSLSLFAIGIALSGVMIAGVDMAPVFAGSLMGVASAVGGLACFLAPVIVGLLTSQETLAEWHIVFWINLIVVGSSGFVYVIFGSAEVQAWNYPDVRFATEVTTKERKDPEEKP